MADEQSTLEQADAVIRDREAKFNDPANLYSPHRAEWVEDTIRAHAAKTAAQARAAAPAPVESDGPALTPEQRIEAAQAARADRKALDAGIREARAELANLDHGHPRTRELIEELNDLTNKRQKLEAPTGALTGLSFDIVDPPRPTPAVEPEPDLAALPPLARGERWEDGLPGLREVDVLAEREGWLDALPGVLHLVRHAHEDARGWTAETTAAEWERRHGPERAAELMAAATALEADLKQHAPKFLAWVTRLGVQYDPALIEHALGVRSR